MNRRKVREIRVGTRFWLGNTLWTVVILTGSALTCRSSTGEAAVISVTEVYEHADWEDPLSADDPASNDTSDVNLATATDTPLTESAKRRITAVNLLTTGYPDGILNPEKDPHPVYGPQNGEGLDARVAAYSHDHNVAARTIYRWLKAARNQGTAALIDKRAVKQQRPLGNCPAEIASAFHEVIVSRDGESDTTDIFLVTRVKRHLKRKHGEDFPLPSDRTLVRYLEQFKILYGLNTNTKTRRGRALAPEKSGPPIVLSRPFELVEIDTWSWDGFVIDDYNGKTATIKLTLALDVFTRSIVAWNFAVNETKAVDAALLMYDMLAPKPWDPKWGDLAQWRYGVPEHLLLPAGHEDTKLAGVPFGSATTISLDNGKVYVSDTMKSAAIQLGTTLAYGRVRQATDKGHVEAVFETIKDNFVVGLPGFKSHSVEGRGDDIDISNLLFVSEIESLFAEWVATYYQNTPHDSLFFPQNPRRKFTPNEWFDNAVAATGFLSVPQDPDLLISLLPATACRVGTTGFTIDYIQYNSDVLEPYRKVKSPFKGGTWPVRYDPRNLSYVFFWAGDPQLPNVGQWIRVPARVSRYIGAFAQVHVEYAKRAFFSNTTTPFKDRPAALEATMRDLFERVEKHGFINKREENVFRHGATQIALHDARFADPDIAPHPYPEPSSSSGGYSDDEDGFDDLDLDAIEPFPIAGANTHTAVGED